MSGERLRDGLLHPMDLVARLSLRSGARVLALDVPSPYLASMKRAVMPRGDLRVRGGSPCDVAVIWQREDRELPPRVAEALSSLLPQGVLWVLAIKQGKKKPVPGAVTVAEVAKLLEPAGRESVLTVSVGPGRYALLFRPAPSRVEGRPAAGVPGTRP